MNLYKLTPKKNTAQAMVEFAIVLPLLLLLLYGLLEAGRLLFMYSTVVTASRQAARYGSATGEGLTPGVARYQDCAGIRAAAERVDFLRSFSNPSDPNVLLQKVLIQWDTGPGTTLNTICLTSDPQNWAPASGNITRIVVTIRGDFNPIIPRIVPFIARTEAGGNPIRAISARTIITGVPIEVTPPPGSEGGSGGGLSLVITPSPNSYTGPNQQIDYTFTLTNGTANDLSGPFTITLTDAPFSVTCPAGTLAKNNGSSLTCIVSSPYITTQPDVDTGFFKFTAIASEPGGLTTTITSQINLATASTELTLTVRADPGAYLNVGDSITYRYTVTNGTLPVEGLIITDDKVSGITCTLTTLPPTTPTSCMGTYSVTQADIDATFIQNNATASATTVGETTAIPSNQASGMAILANPKLTLTKTVTPLTTAPGSTVTYNFALTNSGNVSLSAVSISDPLLGGPVAGCSTSTLAAGGLLTCGAPYVAKSQDAPTLVNTATASGTFGSLTVQAQANATAEVLTNRLFLEVSATPTSISQPNQSVTYTYKLTNGSSQALEGAYVLTGDLPAALNNCFAGTLAVGASQTCTATYSAQTAFDSGATSIQNNNIKVTACVPKSNCRDDNLVQSNTVSAPPVTITGQSPVLALQVTVSTSLAKNLNQQVIYTYRLTNGGNVSLKQPFTINDPTLGVITCSNTADIAVGAFRDCTKTYNITQADIDAGSIPIRQVTASATYIAQAVSATAQAPKVTTFEGSRLKLEIFANPVTYPAAPAIQPISYTYRITNTGTNPLTSNPQPYLEKSDQSDGTTTWKRDVFCPSQPLAPGDSINCTATDELNGPPGSKITNTATAQANDGISMKAISSNTATVTVSNPVLTCNATNIVGTAINKNMRTMTAAFTNNTGVALAIKDVTVRWNHNNGQSGNDKTLKMQDAQLNGVKFREWISSSNWLFVPVATITPTSQISLPPGASTFTFTFHQDYLNWEAGPETNESVSITFNTAGCEGVTITYTRP